MIKRRWFRCLKNCALCLFYPLTTLINFSLTCALIQTHFFTHYTSFLQVTCWAGLWHTLEQAVEKDSNGKRLIVYGEFRQCNGYWKKSDQCIPYNSNTTTKKDSPTSESPHYNSHLSNSHSTAKCLSEHHLLEPKVDNKLFGCVSFSIQWLYIQHKLIPSIINNLKVSM